MSDTIRGLFIETNGHIQIVSLQKGDLEPVHELLGIGNELKFTSVGHLAMISTPVRTKSEPNPMAVVILYDSFGIKKPVRGPVILTGPIRESQPTDLLDTGFTIDGMDPAEWIEAIEME